MSLLDWTHWLLYQLSISLLAVGGAMTLAPGLHRFLVDQHGWLSPAQFNTALTLAQVAPGPNTLYIALLGWQVGLGSAGAPAGTAWPWLAAFAGLLLSLVGTLGPSSVLALLAARWGQRHRERRAVRAFRQGMAPLVVGVVFSTAWLLARANNSPAAQAPWLWAVTAVTALLIWHTRLHLLWLLGAGAALGALGWL